MPGNLRRKLQRGSAMGPYELLGHIVEILERLQIPYIVTGSIASMAYGEPRLTNDIDIVADVEEKHISGLLEAFPPNEFYISEDMIRDAIRRKSQFNIIHPASGLKIDIIIDGKHGNISLCFCMLQSQDLSKIYSLTDALLSLKIRLVRVNV